MRKLQVASSETGRSTTLAVFMLAHFSHHLCSAAVVPLLPMIRDTFGLDYLRSGLLLSALTLTLGFVQLPAAVLSDRISKRRLVAVGLISTGAASIGIGISTDYTQLLLCLVALGAGASTYHAPSAAFLSQTFGREARGRSLGLHAVGGNGGLMAAPILAILVANITGSWRNAFLALAVPILLAGILVWTVARTQDSANLAAAAKEADGGPGWFQGLRTLGLLLAISMAAQLVFSGINSFLPLYLVDTRAASSDVAGLMVGVVYAAGLLGGPLGGTLSDRIGRKPVILMSVISMGPTMFLITISPMGPAMIAAIALYGLLVTLRFPTIESLIADEIPARRRATVMGGYYFLAQETSGIFTPAFGWLIDQSGMDNGFSLLTLVAVVCSLLVLWFWRKM